MQNQKQVWENISKEWNEFKKIPAQSVIEFLKKQKGNVLDFGSGSGRNLMKIKEGKMFLLDFSEGMIKLAEEKAKKEKIKAEFTVSSMIETPYEDEFFDGAICISALHCLNKSEQKKAVKELYRILKPRAQILVGVWNKDSKRLKRHKGKEAKIKWNDKGERYYYLFDEKEVKKLFEENKFKIVKTENSEMMIRFIAEKKDL
jgi:ubiquinone/menaquinone biosynthesis C-methylase UbiE